MGDLTGLACGGSGECPCGSLIGCFVDAAEEVIEHGDEGLSISAGDAAASGDAGDAIGIGKAVVILDPVEAIAGGVATGEGTGGVPGAGIKSDIFHAGAEGIV